MPVEHHLLFAVLAFEDELIDLQQLTAACRAWAGDKSKPLADLLVERGWVTAEDRGFLEKKAERKLARHQDDPRVTLNAVTRGDVCDVLRKEVDDSEIRQSLSSWPMDAPVLIEAIGQTLDESQQPKTRYTWLSEVGAGGLGKVWLARDNDLSREVALKEIKPGSASSEAVRRLIKEAQITGQLQHPGIVPVYEVSHEGRPFYTMKLVRGETLSQAIREHHELKQAGEEDPLSERKLLNVFLNICNAIAYAHSRGVIHRDLKPDNIVLGEYGEAIVLDWGLARQVSSEDEDSAPIVVTEDGRTDATQAGQTLGTPAYMAPEQASGRVEHMDARTDIYGLGAILFEILTGQSPHQRDTTDTVTSGMAALLHGIATEDSPRVRSIDKTIPGELDDICATAMAKHRDKRYQTAKNLKEALLEFQVHEESIELATRADDDLAAARRSGKYDDFSRAQFGFETALKHWPENVRATEGLSETRRDYSQAAFDRGDFDLALTLLDPSDPGQAGLATTIQAAAEERASRTDRIRRLRRFGLAASLTVAVLASVASVWINSERTKALTAQQEEATQRGIAQRREKEAREDRQAAIASEKNADEERLNAILARRKAEDERQKAVASQKVAERNAYTSDMFLAQHDWETASSVRIYDVLDRHRDRDDLKGFEWSYLDRVAHSDLHTFTGHTALVASVAFSPDGLRLASASYDGTVKVWDSATGQESLTLKGHTGEVNSVTFSPDGQRLASASSDQTVKVWDAATGEESLTLKGHTRGVTSVAFSPDGQRLASASYDETVKVWDAATGQELLTLKGHTSVAFSPDGQRLASASDNGTVKVWNSTTGQESLTLRGHTGSVYHVSFSPDGQRLASASKDKTVKVWDAATGQELFTLKGHAKDVASVAFSPDGRRLASASMDQTVKVWDSATGEELLTLKGHSDFVWGVTFSPNGHRLASASYDHTVKVWSADTRQESIALNGHAAMVNSVAFSPDGQRLASASRDETVKVWDAATGQELSTLNGHSDRVTSVVFSPDGQRLASASYDMMVKVWDADSGNLSLSLKGHTDRVFHVVFSPDGLRLASASWDNTVKVWDAASGEESHTLKGHARGVTCVAFNPEGSRLASAGADRTVKMWDVASGQDSLTLKGHADSVLDVAFSPDGRRLASASFDGTVKMWDTATGRELLTLKGHTGEVRSVAFSPDGRRLASAAAAGAYRQPGEVKVWDARPWTPELRAQSQARGMLTVKRDRVKSLEELQETIRSDKTISELVRKQALDWAVLFWNNRQPRQDLEK